MDTKALSYFASNNPLARKIIHEQQLAQDFLGNDWAGLTWQEQETLIDDLFVDSKTRMKYVSCQKKNSYPVSFPKLTVHSGEKIIVDMESDFWSRQDEHSAPFSWKSKSQQDLTLDDLDQEKQNKNQARVANKSKQSSDEPVMAPDQFVFKPGESVWEEYRDWKKQVCPAKERSPASNGHGLGMQNHIANDNSEQQTTGEVKETSPPKTSSVDPGKQSPVPPVRKNKGQSTKNVSKLTHGGKVPLSSSFSKKHSEEEEDLVKVSELKDFPKAHKDIESNVFDNPVMNVYERNATEDEAESVSSTTSSPRRPLLQEPRQQMIDRELTEDMLMVNAGKASLDTTELLTVTEYQDVELSVPDKDVEDTGNTSSSIPATGFGFLDNW